MRIRALIGVLIGLFLVFEAATIAVHNRDLLFQPFQLGAGIAIPFYLAIFLVFLLGFFPPAAFLFHRSLEQDLERRRDRRRDREAVSFGQGFRRALDFEADGQWSRAATELENLLAEKPEDFVTLVHYGEVLRQQGRSDLALETHRRASVLYPGSVALLYQLAADYEAKGDFEATEELQTRIVRDAPGFGLEVLRRRRSAAMKAGKWDEALRWHDRIGTLLADTDDEGRREKESEIEQGLAYQRGVVLLEDERVNEALAIFRRLLQQEPRFIPAAIMAGEGELLLGHETEALEEWRRGFLATGSPVFLQRFEDYFIENEEPARAIETLRELMGQTDRDLLVRFFLGRLYYRLEMLEEAVKVLEELRERLDASPTYHYLLGRIRQRRQDVQPALAHYQKALVQSGVPKARYVCRTTFAGPRSGRCQAEYPEWQGRCDECGSWNSLDLDLEDERLTRADAGLVERPIWGGDDQNLPSGMTN